MKSLALQIWDDDSGAMLTTEYVYAVALLIIGIIGGFVAVRSALLSGLNQTAQSINSLNSSYRITGQQNPESASPAKIDMSVPVD